MNNATTKEKITVAIGLVLSIIVVMVCLCFNFQKVNADSDSVTSVWQIPLPKTDSWEMVKDNLGFTDEEILDLKVLSWYGSISQWSSTAYKESKHAHLYDSNDGKVLWIDKYLSFNE